MLCQNIIGTVEGNSATIPGLILYEIIYYKTDKNLHTKYNFA